MFFLVDWNIYSSKINLYSHKLYKEEVQNGMLEIGHYLHICWWYAFLNLIDNLTTKDRENTTEEDESSTATLIAGSKKKKDQRETEVDRENSTTGKQQATLITPNFRKNADFCKVRLVVLPDWNPINEFI